VRKSRSQFGLEAQDYFDHVQRLEAFHGYPGINTLAVMFAKSDDRKEIDPPSQSKHKVLSMGMPVRHKARNSAYYSLTKIDQAILRLQWGYMPENGKTATKAQRAEIAGVSVQRFGLMLSGAARRWKAQIRHFKAERARVRNSAPPN